MGAKYSVLPSRVQNKVSEEPGRSIDVSYTLKAIEKYLQKDQCDALLNWSIFPLEETQTFAVPEQVMEFHCDPGNIFDVKFSRAVGCMLGLAIGDSWGHLFEFTPFADSSYFFKELTAFNLECWDKCSKYGNKFRLQPGQWTDDTSMALCMADSLLIHGKPDYVDMRARFVMWWSLGYNCGFRGDRVRRYKCSIGLGGNISESLVEFMTQHLKTEMTAAGTTITNGNGGLMRLAPIPIFYHDDLNTAVEVAALSSLTTHQGIEASECARVLSYIIVKAINYSKVYLEGDSTFAQKFFDSLDFEEIKPQIQTPAVQALVESRQQDGEFVPDEFNEVLEDRNWDWKTEAVVFSPTRIEQNSGYFGSYSLDAMKVALYSVYHSESLEDALLTVINLRGDADTTGAIAGQLAGALYGLQYMPKQCINEMFKWDNRGEIALRAMKLFRKETVSLG
mmetsp:Transcript_22648/g.25500  ORF Transcript_22648/g.25500 Transcript_22648/m.25500 type:complete len:450 (+) Transcript_22648:87-1436(+)